MDSHFWTPDYQSGVNVLFDKLRQGVTENAELLSMLQERIAVENTYGLALQSIQQSRHPAKDGFDRDEGASLRMAFVSYLDEISNQGAVQSRVASDMDRNIRGPFQSFALNHRKAVNEAYTTLSKRISDYHKAVAQVHKAQHSYYEKCRRLEDITSSVSGKSTPTESLESKISRVGVTTKRFWGSVSSSWGVSSYEGAEPAETTSNNSSVDSVPRDKGHSRSLSLAPNQTQANTNTTNTFANLARNGTIRGFISRAQSGSQLEDESPSTKVIDLGNSKIYSSEDIDRIVKAMVNDVPRSSYRIPLWGTYENVSIGFEIVLWLRKRLNCTIATAEKFGQGLVDLGYLRTAGQVSSKFVNSDGRYQWLEKSFSSTKTNAKSAEESVKESAEEPAEETQLVSNVQPDKQDEQPEDDVNHAQDTDTTADKENIPQIQTVDANTKELKPEENNHQLSSEDAQEVKPTPPVKNSLSLSVQTQRDALDMKYRELIMEVDRMRCDLEEKIVDVLGQMEKRELERLALCKKLLKLFAEKFCNPKEVQDIQQRLRLHSESVSAESDLKYLIDGNQTGMRDPEVVVYRNFESGSMPCQTFGVELQNVKFIIPLFIEYFEKHSDRLLELEDEADASEPPNSQSPNIVKRFVKEWTDPVSLVEVHQLRMQINDGKKFNAETIFSFFPNKVVIAVFKQLLLELPDSVISFTLYESVRGMYEPQEIESKSTTEISSMIANKLMLIARNSLDALEMIISFWTKSLSLSTSTSEAQPKSPSDDTDAGDDLNKFISSLAFYLFRPRAGTATSRRIQSDHHAEKLLKDLLLHKDEIFGKVRDRLAVLRRQRSLSEANRRSALEARTRDREGAHNRHDSRSSATTTSSALSSPGMSASVISSQGLIPLTLSQLDGNSSNSNTMSNQEAAATATTKYLSTLSPNSANKLGHRKSASSLGFPNPDNNQDSLSRKTTRSRRHASFVMKLDTSNG